MFFIIYSLTFEKKNDMLHLCSFLQLCFEHMKEVYVKIKSFDVVKDKDSRIRIPVYFRGRNSGSPLARGLPETWSDYQR